MHNFIVVFLNALIISGILVGYKQIANWRAEKKKQRSAPMAGLQKDHRKAFQEAFGEICRTQTAIKEVIVVYGVEGKSDFVIGIRMADNIKANHEMIISELHRHFFKKTKFIFMNLEIPETGEMLHNGTVIVQRKI